MEKEFTAIQQLVNTLIEFFVNYSFQVIGAIIVLIVGTLAANWIAGIAMKVCEKRKLDVTLSKFLAGFIKLLIVVFAIIIALGKFGITIAPFIAALGAVAFGSTLALQGPLSNYGAGLSLILSRRFAVGDTITVQGVNGVVQDVSLACTVLTTEDGEKITIPNNQIMGQILHNSGPNRVVEAAVGVSYDSSLETAIQAIRRALSQFNEVSVPAPQIGVKEFADSSINIGYRYWVPTVKYFQTLYAVNLAVFAALQESKITIPFPQRVVHMTAPARA